VTSLRNEYAITSIFQPIASLGIVVEDVKVQSKCFTEEGGAVVWKNKVVALQGISVIELRKTCNNIAKNSTCADVGFVGHFQCHNKPHMSKCVWVENLLWITGRYHIELLILYVMFC
jgi:hypothetical protein